MASRISMSEAQSLPDILSGDNWRLNIPDIPNGNGDGTTLSIKCQNATIPGRTSGAFEVMLGGHVRTFRGMVRSTNEMTASFVEDITLDTFNKLRGWLEGIGGTESGTAMGNVSDYAVSAELSIFDQAGNEIDVINYRNYYIVAVQETPIEVNGSAAMLVQAQFRHDTVTYQNTQTR